MPEYIDILNSTQHVPYEEAVFFMEDRVAKIAQNSDTELLWFLEHPPLYTGGTSSKRQDLLSDALPVYKTGRGGEYTYHGPGQRVIYLMLDLKKDDQDLHKYVHALEEWIIVTLKDLGIDSERRKGRVGIWVCNDQVEEKIAAIGIRVKKWVSYHGIAINLNPQMQHFKGIVPCGIKDYGVTSINLQNPDITMRELDKALIKNFKSIFRREIKNVRYQ